MIGGTKQKEINAAGPENVGVVIASDVRSERRRNLEYFSLLHNVVTYYGAHPATRQCVPDAVSFAIKRPGPEATHSI
jgi:ribosomal protein L30E